MCTLQKKDTYPYEQIKALLNFFRSNFLFQEELSCTDEGLQRCRKNIEVFAALLLRAPDVLLLFLKRIGIKKKRAIQTPSELKALLLDAELTKFMSPVCSPRLLSRVAILEIAYQQLVIAVQSLARLERALQQHDLQQICRQNIYFHAAIGNARTGLCYISLQMVKPERAFPKEFTRYIHTIRVEKNLKTPRMFWGFLRMETKNAPICIGTQWIQVYRQALRYGTSEQLDEDSQHIKKVTVDKYFSDSKRQISLLYQG